MTTWWRMVDESSRTEVVRRKNEWQLHSLAFQGISIDSKSRNHSSRIRMYWDIGKNYLEGPEFWAKFTRKEWRWRTDLRLQREFPKWLTKTWTLIKVSRPIVSVHLTEIGLIVPCPANIPFISNKHIAAWFGFHNEYVCCSAWCNKLFFGDGSKFI